MSEGMFFFRGQACIILGNTTWKNVSQSDQVYKLTSIKISASCKQVGFLYIWETFFNKKFYILGP